MSNDTLKKAAAKIRKNEMKIYEDLKKKHVKNNKKDKKDKKEEEFDNIQEGFKPRKRKRKKKGVLRKIKDDIVDLFSGKKKSKVVKDFDIPALVKGVVLILFLPTVLIKISSGILQMLKCYKPDKIVPGTNIKIAPYTARGSVKGASFLSMKNHGFPYNLKGGDASPFGIIREMTKHSWVGIRKITDKLISIWSGFGYYEKLIDPKKPWRKKVLGPMKLLGESIPALLFLLIVLPASALLIILFVSLGPGAFVATLYGVIMYIIHMMKAPFNLPIVTLLKKMGMDMSSMQPSRAHWAVSMTYGIFPIFKNIIGWLILIFGVIFYSSFLFSIQGILIPIYLIYFLLLRPLMDKNLSEISNSWSKYFQKRYHVPLTILTSVLLGLLVWQKAPGLGNIVSKLFNATKKGAKKGANAYNMKTEVGKKLKKGVKGYKAKTGVGKVIIGDKDLKGGAIVGAAPFWIFGGLTFLMWLFRLGGYSRGATALSNDIDIPLSHTSTCPKIYVQNSLSGMVVDALAGLIKGPMGQIYELWKTNMATWEAIGNELPGSGARPPNKQ